MHFAGVHFIRSRTFVNCVDILVDITVIKYLSCVIDPRCLTVYSYASSDRHNRHLINYI